MDIGGAGLCGCNPGEASKVRKKEGSLPESREENVAAWVPAHQMLQEYDPPKKRPCL